MKSTRALLFVLASVGWAGAAHAVALGEINVTSHLNQPLVATIPVATSKPGELESATVELASNEEFDRAGMERPEFLSALRFEIKDGYIKVTSKEIAREPFVSFLLDIRWGGGHLLREYTVLLDPPTAGAVTAAPAVRAVETPPRQAESNGSTSAGTAPAESQMAPADSSSAVVPSPAVVAAPAAGAGGGTYGPTQPQETLWSIAYKLRPDLSLTMDQMQVAIFNANPQAFDHGRINGLMKNQMLRVPTAEEVRAIDPAAAKAQVARARAGGAPAAALPAKPVPSPRSVKPEPKPEQKPELPTEPRAESATATASSAPSPAPAPRQEPKSEAPAAATPLTSSPPPASTLTQSTTPAPAEPTPQPTETVAPPPPAPEAARPVESPKPTAAASPKAQSGSIASDITDSIAGLVGQGWFIPAVAGFVLLLAAIFGLNKMRDRYAKWAYQRAAQRAAPKEAPSAALGDEDQASGGDEPMDFGAAAQDAVTQVAATQALGAQTLQQNLQSTVQQTQIMEPPRAQTGGHKVDFDVTGNFANETVQINLDAGDPVSEAEFHRAYGLYDEAALLLKQALQKDPARTDARIKLAEIYFEASKAAEFIETARQLKGQISPEEWQKIALLGTQIAPDNELFADGAAAATGTVDLSFDEPAAAETPPAPAGDSLEFDLGSLSLDTPAETPSPSASAGDSLEFDLGSLSLDTPSASESSAPAVPSTAAPAGGDELNLADFDLGAEAAAPPAEASADAGMESLDLGGDLTIDPGTGGDESSTKLDLARAYIDMGDNDMAKSLLSEVVAQGNAQQKSEAQELLKRAG